MENCYRRTLMNKKIYILSDDLWKPMVQYRFTCICLYYTLRSVYDVRRCACARARVCTGVFVYITHVYRDTLKSTLTKKNYFYHSIAIFPNLSLN